MQVKTEEYDKNFAEIVSDMDKFLRVHSRSDKRIFTLEEQADARTERQNRTKRKKRTLQEIDESQSSVM